MTHPDGMSSEPRIADRSLKWWRETGEFELRQILHWLWDPIGVAREFPYAADEYHSYAAEIVSSLAQGASASEIALLLASIENDRMWGAGPYVGEPSDRLLDLGEAIVAWYTASQERWHEFGPLPRQ